MRMLTPREHGTYAQLLFPILSGLMAGPPKLSSLSFVLAVSSLYLAYEPVAVLLGIRGVRLQREQHGLARRQLAILVPAALLLAITALALAPAGVKRFMLLPALPCILLLPLVPGGRVKSLAGETLVAAALASVHLPLAAEAGARGVALWGAAAVWFAGFFLATLAVHGIKARQKQRQPGLRAAAFAIPALTLAAATTLALGAPALRWLAVVLTVPVLAVLGVNAARVHPRALKRVGWTLVAANTLTLALLAWL